MKKIVLIMLTMLAFAGQVLATQRYIAVYKNRADDVAEINYYLEHGGKVVMMSSTSDNDAAHCYVVVEYPDGVPIYKKK